MVNYKPEGYRTITPYLCVKGVNKLIEFLKKAFNVEVRHCSTTDDGTTMHAEVLVGDSWIMLGEAKGDVKCVTTPTNLYMYVQDTDKVYSQALKAGAESVMKPADMFYGDRNCGVKDPAGKIWWIATHIEDVSPEEMEKRAKEHNKQPVGSKK